MQDNQEEYQDEQIDDIGYRPTQIPTVPDPVPLNDPVARDAPEKMYPDTPKQSGGAVWVGASDAPGRADDGISDLFEVDGDSDTDDLISVDIDKDIIDADDDGTLDDLTSVSEADILGDDFGQAPLQGPGTMQGRVRRTRPVIRRVIRPAQPGMRQIGY